MTSRIIETQKDLDGLVAFLGAREMPYTVNVTKGKNRSVDQNRLQWLLINEIADQTGHTAEEARAYCKLAIGIPILRADDEHFREQYDRMIQPHTADERLEMMGMPMDFGVTRLMTTKQMTKYLDRIYQHFSEKGLVLTVPEH